LKLDIVQRLLQIDPEGFHLDANRSLR
jgi:hypothetical protein